MTSWSPQKQVLDQHDYAQDESPARMAWFAQDSMDSSALTGSSWDVFVEPYQYSKILASLRLKFVRPVCPAATMRYRIDDPMV